MMKFGIYPWKNRKNRTTGRDLVAGAWMMSGIILVSLTGQVLRAQPDMPSPFVPQGIFSRIAFDQNLNGRIPLDAMFKDEEGKSVPLGAYFGARPVIINLVYYQCPMLCTQVLNGLVLGMRSVRMSAGEDFSVVTVSIDPTETPALAAEKKQAYIHRYGRKHAAEGWHFLTGQDADIHKLAASIGYRYFWDSTSQLYAHPAGIVIATPQGRISRYMFGAQFPSRDLSFSLIDASEGKIGSQVEKFLLMCYHYDPGTGKYGVVVMRVLRIAAVFTLLTLGGMIWLLLRWEKRKKIPAAPAPLR